MLKLDEKQKDFVVTVCTVSICIGIVLGVATCKYLSKQDAVLTWQEIVDTMPSKIKQDIAFDFLRSDNSWRHTMCNLPMDGKVK